MRMLARRTLILGGAAAALGVGLWRIGGPGAGADRPSGEPAGSGPATTSPTTTSATGKPTVTVHKSPT